MKNITTLLLALGLMGGTLSSTCFAQSSISVSSSSSEKADKALRPGQYPAQKSVATLKTFNGKVNTKADYYIYLQSASWCGPCQSEMPEIAAEYLKMKKSKRVELILLGADQTKDAAQAFVKQHKAKFPVILGTDPKVEKLVGYTKASGIPNAIIIDKNGKVIKSGHGSIVKQWETYCPEIEDEEEKD